MITDAVAGESFPYGSRVYSRTAISNKSYADWGDDLEELDDHADSVVPVFLNDQLR
jgi:hypothetical protein